MKSAPEVHGPDVFEYEGGRLCLVGSSCPQCGAAFYPPQAVCARCGHRGGDKLLLGPEGTVYTWSRVHRSTPEFKPPYVLVYVDFPQDVRVLMPLSDAAEPQIGDTVELAMEDGPRVEAGNLVPLVHARPVQK